ncbi:phosphodiester glycosidase family protein [Methylocystis iwaonis]|uniref:phosphodiester glycosidase family protein n=1 Tax=Methylocystis iwaonis TaxID=2885079 RepID=UPI002E7B48EF|nr:phosphodiester glycosidase family protein [Methylocystis iwaonis]
MRIAHRRLTTALALSLICAAPHAANAACAEMSQAGASYTVCDYDARKTSIRLFLRDARGETYGAFSRLADDLSSKGQSLIFAMNAGMYGEDFSPVGLYVEAGKMSHAANTANGAGNFHLKPNGVFWIDGAWASVTETGRFLRSGVRTAYATQSGPMLLIGGRINPHIHESGTSEKFRNGVGVFDGHVVRFAISNQPVTFHQFASLFRDRLKCADALFLDGGSASALYAPSISRHDRFHPMGPLIGVVEKAAR